MLINITMIPSRLGNQDDAHQSLFRSYTYSIFLDLPLQIMSIMTVMLHGCFFLGGGGGGTAH